MTFHRTLRLLVCVLAFLAGFTGVSAAAQRSSAPAAQAAPSMAGADATATPAAGGQAYTLPPKQLAKAIQISRIRDMLNIAGSIWGIVFVWLLLVARGWAGIERWAQKISGSRWIQGVVFFAAFFVVSELASLPLDWIGQHYERAYGVSVQGWPDWLGDEAKSLGLTILIGVPVLLLFNWIVRRWPRRYWLGIWVATLPILVFAVFVSPLVVPLFYHQEPLEEHHAALVVQLEKVVARTGINIPPDRMYLIKASAKSKGINAFVAGIGATKRYVMWDTATDQLPDDEILFVFGHESGHYVLHHIPKELAGDAIGLFFMYWACAVFAAWLVRRSGARWGTMELHPTDKELSEGTPGLSSRTGFVVLLFTISVASFLLEPAGNAFSRHFEHQADVYGQEAIHGIVPDPQKTAVAAFNALGRSWLEDPNPNPIIEFWLFSHPSVQQRADFAAHYDPWKNGGHGKYFKN